MWPFVRPNRAIVRRIEALEEDFAALEARHKALVGRFYATRTPRTDPPDPPATTREAKDAILRDFLAGRVKHGT